MISEAVQTTLATIIPNTQMSIGDEEIETPFCIHEERDEPEYLKEGLVHYVWSVEIAVIDTTPDSCESYTMQIKTALEALAGTTVETTNIESVNYEGSEPGFDQQTNEYIRISRYIITTNNR